MKRWRQAGGRDSSMTAFSKCLVLLTVFGLPAAAVRRQAHRVTGSFVSGLELASLYYAEAVRPLLDEEFPGLRYTAALVGPGSEVLGFDSARSTDHNWGPRLQLFLSDADDVAGLGVRVSDMLAARLPAAFRGHPTAFPRSGAPGARPAHWITVAGMRRWLIGALGLTPVCRSGCTTGCPYRRRCWPNSPAARSSTTGWPTTLTKPAGSGQYGQRSPGTRAISGCM